jgi:hypothetical protein
VLFGVSHDQKEPLLKFDKDVMQNCFECATGMLSGPQTQMAGAGLLSEVTRPLRPMNLCCVHLPHGATRGSVLGRCLFSRT